jgi:hypothetical protein
MIEQGRNTPDENLAPHWIEPESVRAPSENPRARFGKFPGSKRANRGLFLVVSVVVLIALVPLYGILFPPLVDLPEHLLMSKLLWEKLSGVSHLDLEISFFLGYRLFPALMMIVISFCKLTGISLVYLPRLATGVLISLQGIVVTTILYSALKDKSWRSCLIAIGFSLPATVCIYSAAWFIGFVNYTLAVTALIPAIFLTETFLRSGKRRDASLLFLALLMVYAAHPFAVTFWALWCLSSAIISIVTGAFVREWKKLILLGAVFLPIFLYHVWVTRGTALAPSGRPVMNQWPFVSLSNWTQHRFWFLLDGSFFGADDAADPRLFGLMALGLILVSTVFAFTSNKDQFIRKIALASVLFFILSSWVDDKIFPIPQGFWLAYEFRFVATAFVICLVVAGVIFIRSLPALTGKAQGRTIVASLVSLSVLASADHLLDVRKAYRRFDVQAQKYMAKVFDQVEPTGIDLPHSRYHPDGSFLKQYVCLKQNDCIPPGSTFAIFSSRGAAGDLYPVKMRVPGSSRPAQMAQSRANSLLPFPSSLLVPFLSRALGDGLVGYWKLDEPNGSDVCIDASGYGNAGTPHGTTVVDGKVNRARSFNGQSDYIDLPTVSTPRAITVAAWVYADTFLQNGFIVTKNPVNTQWALFLQFGVLMWRGGAAGPTITCPGPSNQNWHYIVGTQKGSAASLYVDGRLCASGTLPAIGNASSSIGLGRYDTVNFDYFLGRIDEVRIYDRALSGREISELFRSSDSPSHTPVSSRTK